MEVRQKLREEQQKKMRKVQEQPIQGREEHEGHREVQ